MRNINIYTILKIIVFIFFLLVSSSCGEWSNDYDFRNYLRDKHPYSEIIKTELGSFTYQVNDTLNDRIYIYTTTASKRSVISHCVNCKNQTLLHK